MLFGIMEYRDSAEGLHSILLLMVMVVTWNKSATVGDNTPKKHYYDEQPNSYCGHYAKQKHDVVGLK